MLVSIVFKPILFNFRTDRHEDVKAKDMVLVCRWFQNMWDTNAKDVFTKFRSATYRISGLNLVADITLKRKYDFSDMYTDITLLLEDYDSENNYTLRLNGVDYGVGGILDDD